jgi:hypothetical protein
MTTYEKEKIIKELKEFSKKMSKEEARAFLISTGIYDKKGKLKKEYKRGADTKKDN